MLLDSHIYFDDSLHDWISKTEICKYLIYHEFDQYEYVIWSESYTHTNHREARSLPSLIVYITLCVRFFMLNSFEPQTSKVFKYDVIIYQCRIISLPVNIKEEKTLIKDGGETKNQVY